MGKQNLFIVIAIILLFFGVAYADGIADIIQGITNASNTANINVLAVATAMATPFLWWWIVGKRSEKDYDRFIKQLEEQYNQAQKTIELERELRATAEKTKEDTISAFRGLAGEMTRRARKNDELVSRLVEATIAHNKDAADRETRYRTAFTESNGKIDNQFVELSKQINEMPNKWIDAMRSIFLEGSKIMAGSLDALNAKITPIIMVAQKDILERDEQHPREKDLAEEKIS